MSCTTVLTLRPSVSTTNSATSWYSGARISNSRASVPRGSAIIQQRPVRAAAGPGELLFHRGSKIHDVSASAQALATARVENCATAGREHQPVGQRQVVDDFRLALPEPRFALAFEDVGDVDAGPGLDLVVAVDERQAEPTRQLPGHGALAGPHRPYEEHVHRDSAVLRRKEKRPQVAAAVHSRIGRGVRQ